MNITDKLAKIAKELYEIYHSDNDAPRLINEMLKELPDPRGRRSSSGQPMTHNIPG